ncbi:MAG: endonuclease MutS2 [Bacillota bacterium]|nr:endonuclease MutS2 [Bacillota bacterium]
MDKPLLTSSRTLAALDWEVIRERLAQRTMTEGGKALAGRLFPQGSLLWVERELSRTEEAAALLQEGSALPWSSVHRIGPYLERARRGGLLEGRALFQIAQTSRAAREIKGILLRSGGPELKDVGEALPSMEEGERAILRAISPDGEIQDEASPLLAELRREERREEERLRRFLDRLIRSPQMQDYLQEAVITQRQQRFVVPVRASYRHQVPGILRDVSASGQTAFVEPQGAVEIQERLLLLARKREAEEERILRALSALVAKEADLMELAEEILAVLDLTFARAEMSLSWKGLRPGGLRERALELHQGRHPLLEGDVVPMDLELSGPGHGLLLTGPNTGGKTVALKTVGLMVFLHQSGFLPPVGEGTKLPFFEKVFCDVGDEQDVQQNLSTFSAHLLHVKEMLEGVGGRSLVLLDEVGSGTDPEEGAALAMALLDYFLERGAYLLATTHLGPLKAFAERHPRLQNGAVEFDLATLAPTYRLLMGKPGQSYALEIARRLGLPEPILKAAEAYRDPEERRADRLLTRLEEMRVEAEAALRQAQEEELKARELREALEEEKEKLERARARLYEEAAQEVRAWQERVRRELSDLEKKGRLLLESLREETGAKGDEEAFRRRIKELKRELERDLVPEGPAQPKPPGSSFQPGERVYVQSLRAQGEVAGPPGSGGKVPVQLGPLRVWVDPGDLAVQEVPPRPPAAGRRQVNYRARAEVGPSLDLHGVTVDEALLRLDKYVDDAFLAGYEEVRILHGKGMGILRQEVRRWASAHPLVVSFRPGLPREGGDGVTVLRLKG